MSDQVGGGTTDAAAVGLALAFPDGLRGHLAAMAMTWAPVDEAVAAGSAGLLELGLLTAGLNGSVAVARPAGVGRRGMGLRKEAVVPDNDLPREGLEGGVAAVRSDQAETRVADARAQEVEAGVAPVVVALGGEGDRESGAGAGAGTVDVDEVWTRTMAPDGGSETRTVVIGGGLGSVAPVGAGPGRRPVEASVVPGATVGGTGTVAPMVERYATASVGGSGAAPTAFGDMSWATGSVSSIAPASQPLAGLRADVGTALKEQAAARGSMVAGPELGGGESAAFASGRERGSRGGPMGAGGGEGVGGPGLEAAWAPQPAERGSGGAGGQGTGSVMLDGRLVGHWMSDGMAREAARPGAGTTFFDPRQAPAWTPSGAL